MMLRLLAVREERAQATVEMAVVAPVLIVLALIVYNLGVYVCAVARFDRVAPDIAIAHGASPVSGPGAGSVAAATEKIRGEIEGAMGGYPVEIEVTCSDLPGSTESGGELLSFAGALRTFSCTMRYEPWPRALSVAGVDLGAPVALAHERAVTVDPWRPGVVL